MDDNLLIVPNVKKRVTFAQKLETFTEIERIEHSFKLKAFICWLREDHSFSEDCGLFQKFFPIVFFFY